MNIRRNIDYSEMYEELDMLMTQQLPLMELYCGIGKAVCRRSEKGAAVMASEYLNKQYPDVKGCSPRSLRRMRDFYRTYEDHPNLLSLALQIGWIQNVVIMEAELTMKLRKWYMKAVLKFSWSKTELISNIAKSAHESITLIIKRTENCYENNRNESKKPLLITLKVILRDADFTFRRLNRNYFRRRCRYVLVVKINGISRKICCYFSSVAV